eukprot:g11311.t1
MPTLMATSLVCQTNLWRKQWDASAVLKPFEKRRIRKFTEAGYHVGYVTHPHEGVQLGKDDENIAVDKEAMERLAKEPVILRLDRSGRAIKEGEKVDGLLPWSLKDGRGLHSAQAPKGWEDFHARYGQMEKGVEGTLGPQALNELQSNLARYEGKDHQGRDNFRVIRTLSWPGGVDGGGPTSIMLIGVADMSTRSLRLATRAVYEVEPSALMLELCRERIGKQLVMPREHKEAVANYARGFATTNPHRHSLWLHHLDTIQGDAEALNQWTRGQPYGEALADFASQSPGKIPRLLCLGDVRSSTMERLEKKYRNESTTTERSASKPAGLRAQAQDSAAEQYRPFKDMDLLDIGMGQGPMGVVAIELGIRSYKGMDPALCLNRHARTRDKTIARAPGKKACNLIAKSTDCKNHTGFACPAFRACMKRAREKYRYFPYTGLEMMQAYAGEIVLLPGTFATLQPTGLIQRGSFQVATLWLVTEHLPNNQDVIEGVFEWTEPGQLLVLTHHNYYGFDGHHEMPVDPKAFQRGNRAQAEVAFWRHLEPSSWVFNVTSLNRVRLGDLIGLLNVYFECAWLANFGNHWDEAQRGFSRTELLVSTWSAACARREAPREALWLKSRVWHHPATDGSYEPRTLPKKMLFNRTENRLRRMHVPKSQLRLRQRGLISMASTGHKVVLGLLDTDHLGPVSAWLERAGAKVMAVADASDIESNRESLAADIKLGLASGKASPAELQLQATKVAAQARMVLELDAGVPLGFFLNEEGVQLLEHRKRRLLQLTRLKDLVKHREKAKTWETAEELYVVVPGEKIPGPESRLPGQTPEGLQFEMGRLEIPDHYLRDAGMEGHAESLWKSLVKTGKASEPADPSELQWWASGGIEVEPLNDEFWQQD